MRQRATVEAILPGGRVRLSVQRESACSGDCHRCAGCGAVAQTLSLTACDRIQAQPGECVWVESETAPVLCAAALVYLLPLVSALLTGAVAMPLGAWALLLACIAFGLGLIPALLYDRWLRHRPLRYEVVERVR